MQVVARDVLEHIRGAGVDRDVIADPVTEWLGAFAVDENRFECVASRQGPLHHEVSLGDEPAGHLTAGQFTLLAQGVVSKALEHVDAGVLVVGDLDTAQVSQRNDGSDSATIEQYNDRAARLG